MVNTPPIVNLYRLREDARSRLAHRYADGGLNIATPLLHELSLALRVTPAGRADYYARTLPDPEPGDITAGLVLMEETRERLDRDELELYGHARARGLSWDQIAEQTGSTTAKCRARYGTLRRRYRMYRAPHPDAARWALEHAAELAAAVRVIVDLGAADTPGSHHVQLADAYHDGAGDPETLYWTAYTIASATYISEQDASALGPLTAAVTALADLVCEPRYEPRPRKPLPWEA